MSQMNRIREYFKTVGISTGARCAKALGIHSDVVHSRLQDLLKAGWVRKVEGCPGFYEYHESPTAGRKSPVQDLLWRAIRIAKRFTAWDAAQYSGATLDYSKEYIRFLMAQGLTSKVGKSGQQAIYQVKENPPIRTPYMRSSGKEEERHERIESGWTLMRALLAGDREKASEICEQLIRDLKNGNGNH